MDFPASPTKGVAMKKKLQLQNRKLKISKETLRRMTEGELLEAAGGVVTNGGTSCLTSPCNTL
jgi:hypothetical protein